MQSHIVSCWIAKFLNEYKMFLLSSIRPFESLNNMDLDGNICFVIYMYSCLKMLTNFKQEEWQVPVVGMSCYKKRVTKVLRHLHVQCKSKFDFWASWKHFNIFLPHQWFFSVSTNKTVQTRVLVHNTELGG